MATHFSPEALKFLRGLQRHNDRAWFDPRKAAYEREIKQPMLALIDEVNHAFADFAPEHVRPSHKTMMRIYRDTRFDASRGTAPRPYKTNVAAWWVRAGLEKTSGAGFYFHFSPKETVLAAGAYMPSAEQLLAIRRHIERNYKELRAILGDRKLKASEMVRRFRLAAPLVHFLNAGIVGDRGVSNSAHARVGEELPD